jgi:hypothetical protein
MGFKLRILAVSLVAFAFCRLSWQDFIAFNQPNNGRTELKRERDRK